jgi:MFS superfamily sulfate permease-like transporter
MKQAFSSIPWKNWQPKLVDCLHGYSSRQFASDLVAGLTVGLVALPLAMAFGIASGVTPQAGIYTAIVGGFLVSLLGGSRIHGTTDKLAEETADLSRFQQIVILRLRNMTAIDATGLHALEMLSDRLKKSGRTLLLCGARSPVTCQGSFAGNHIMSVTFHPFLSFP